VSQKIELAMLGHTFATRERARRIVKESGILADPVREIVIGDSYVSPSFAAELLSRAAVGSCRVTVRTSGPTSSLIKSLVWQLGLKNVQVRRRSAAGRHHQQKVS